MNPEDETKERPRSEQSRQDIVDAAHKLFVSQGYHGTSMRQIAAGAGLALGGLYNHFDSKDAIFREVINQYHPYREIIPIIAEAASGPVDAFIHEAFLRTIKVIEDRPDFLNLMFIEIVEFNGEHLSELFQIISPQATPIIERLMMNDPENLRRIPPFMLIRIFVSILIGYFVTDRVFGQFAPIETRQGALDTYVNVLLHGILNHPSSRQQEAG